MRIVSAAAVLAALAGALFLGERPASGQGNAWGTVKGQIVWPGDMPEIVELKVDKDQAACLAKGKIVSEEFVIDPKSKGVQWVFVWLEPLAKGAKMPIHPGLVAIKDKEIVVDQPCCKFEPHNLAVREGQVLVCKNSSGIAHNFKYDGAKNSGNPLIPAKQEFKIDDLKADARPISMSCSIHGWMKGYIRVFDHPYFAVTDKDGNFEFKNAPDGKYRLKIWHDSGWLGGAKGRDGKEVTIADGKVLDLGKLEWKSE